MSRVGKQPIDILPDVKVEYKDRVFKAQGPLGALEQSIHPAVDLEIGDKVITVSRRSEEKQDRSLHGLYRTLVSNMVTGVKEGFRKVLLVEGIGYRRSLQGKSLVLELGFSHPIVLRIPEGIKIELEDPNQIIVSGIDKQLVGDVAAQIRILKPPEPYKGKGIRYEDEYVRRKAGKTATSQGEA